MSQPTTSLAQLLEDQRKKAESEDTLFQTDRDFQFLTARVQEKSKRVGGTVHFIPVSTERDPQGDLSHSAGVDPLDGDILDPEFRGGSPDLDDRVLNFRCIIEHDPPKQLLKLYGIDEQREIAFWLPFQSLRDEGLVDRWRIYGADIGDLLIWDTTWYQAWNVYRDQYFGQRALAHYIVAFCNRYRHNSQPTGDVADECPEEQRFET